MTNYLRCNKCGYDMCGPEYLATVIDPLSCTADIFHSTNALLEIYTKSDSSIECPLCHSHGDWSR